MSSCSRKMEQLSPRDVKDAVVIFDTASNSIYNAGTSMGLVDYSKNRASLPSQNRGDDSNVASCPNPLRTDQQTKKVYEKKDYEVTFMLRRRRPRRTRADRRGSEDSRIGDRIQFDAEGRPSFCDAELQLVSPEKATRKPSVFLRGQSMEDDEESLSSPTTVFGFSRSTGRRPTNEFQKSPLAIFGDSLSSFGSYDLGEKPVRRRSSGKSLDEYLAGTHAMAAKTSLLGPDYGSGNTSPIRSMSEYSDDYLDELEHELHLINDSGSQDERAADMVDRIMSPHFVGGNTSPPPAAVKIPAMSIQSSKVDLVETKSGVIFEGCARSEESNISLPRATVSLLEGKDDIAADSTSSWMGAKQLEQNNVMHSGSFSPVHCGPPGSCRSAPRRQKGIQSILQKLAASGLNVR